jgi:hypothetical protein
MKRWHWIIPPLLVVAGYFSAGAVLPGGPAEPEAAVAKSRKERREERPRFTIDQAREQFHADSDAEAAPDLEDLQAMDIGQLRQRVLDQLESYQAFKDKLDRASEEVKDVAHLEDAQDVAVDFDFCRQELEKAPGSAGLRSRSR